MWYTDIAIFPSTGIKVVPDYSSWCKDKNYISNTQLNYDTWWKNIAQSQYINYYFNWLDEIKCRGYHNILFSDRSFFDNIREYMKSQNWTWDDKEVTINDLILTVLQLSHASNERGNELSSGGFIISFNINEYLKVAFTEYIGDNIIFEKNIFKQDLRKIKLNKIVNG